MLYYVMWLIGVVVCLLTAPYVKLSTLVDRDGHLMRCTALQLSLSQFNCFRHHSYSTALVILPIAHFSTAWSACLSHTWLILLTPSSTQPFLLPGKVDHVPVCLAGVKAGCVHLCLMAANTVWSHMAVDAL